MPDILITVVSGETTELGLSIPGVQGPVGQGFPSGGTVGQLVVKQSATNYDTAWSATLSGVTINSSIASGLTLQGTVSGGTFVSSTLSGVITNVGTVSGGTYTSPSISGATIFASTLSGNTIAGALVHPLGAVGTPSITFTGDLDTGIYSPGADQLAVATNGTGRLFVDASGNVCLKKEPALPNYSKALTVAATDAAIALRANSLGTYTDQGIFFAVDGVNYSHIYNEGAGQLIFRTGSSLSERLRITSSGGLLIGTSTERNNLFNTTIAPAIQLEGAGIVPAHRFLSVINNYATAGDGGGVMVLGRSKGGTVGSNTVVAAGDQLGRFDFQGNDGTDFVTGATIESYVDGTPGTNDMPGRLVFSTTADGASSPTERMRIDSLGNININTSGGIVSPASSSAFGLGLTITPDGGIAAKTTQAVGSVFFEQNIISYTSGTAVYQRFRVGGTIVGSIATTNGTSTAYNTSSDYRLKENITLLDGAIARLNQLPVHRFNFIADPDTVVDGFIAHEAAAVVPECVTGEKDEVDEDGNPIYQGIDQSKLVPLLTAALQEAVAKIEALEARLTAAGL